MANTVASEAYAVRVWLLHVLMQTRHARLLAKMIYRHRLLLFLGGFGSAYKYKQRGQEDEQHCVTSQLENPRFGLELRS